MNYNTTENNRISGFLIFLAIIAATISTLFVKSNPVENVSADSTQQIQSNTFEIKSTSDSEIKKEISSNDVVYGNYHFPHHYIDKTFGTNQASMYSQWTNLLVDYKTYKPIRVRLSTPETSKSGFDVECIGNCILQYNGKAIDSIAYVGIQKKGSNSLKIVYKKDNQIIEDETSEIHILSNTKNEKDYLKLPFWDRTLPWNKDLNDNTVKGGLDIRNIDNKVIIVNELDFHEYMKGIAEVPEGDQDSKRQVLELVSSSYAMYWITVKDEQKFPKMHYNASDNPDIFQKYRGYNFTLRSPKWQKVVEDQKNEFITYKGNVLRTAYFSCTPKNGYTKNPEQANWNSKYFNSVSEVYQSTHDPHGVDQERLNKGQCGHGVGLSGFGSTNLAKM